MSPPSPPPDSELARQAAGGDDRAFAELVRRHQDDLFRLLKRYLGDPDEAREAAHEAFVAAWGALKRYDPARPFGAWLRTIGVNKARDRGRRMAVRRALFREADPATTEGPAWRASEPAADEAIIETERLRTLERAIARLPDQLKAPLLLTVFEGLSQKEAGETLGVSAKTVETRVYRARKLLADRLARG